MGLTNRCKIDLTVGRQRQSIKQLLYDCDTSKMLITLIVIYVYISIYIRTVLVILRRIHPRLPTLSFASLGEITKVLPPSSKRKNWTQDLTLFSGLKYESRYHKLQDFILRRGMGVLLRATCYKRNLWFTGIGSDGFTGSSQHLDT